MAEVSITYTLDYINPIIAIMKQISERWDREGDKTVYIETFASKGISGYHMSQLAGPYHCNVVQDNRSDMFRFNIGMRSDYDEESRCAKDSATLYYYKHDEHYVLACDILNWIVYGEKPERNPSSWLDMRN